MISAPIWPKQFKQLGVPSANLFKLDIPQNVLKALPFAKIKEYKVIPLEVDEKFTLAMVNPQDYVAIKDIEFILGKRVNPVVVTSQQMNAAIKSLECKGLEDIKAGRVYTEKEAIEYLKKCIRS